MTATFKPIPLHNSFLVRQVISEYILPANAYAPIVEMPDLRVRFSTSETGYNDLGFPTTILGPYTMEPAGDAGVFAYVVPADDVALLAPYLDETIYQVVEGSYGTLYYNLTDVQPLTVIDPRNPPSPVP